MCPLEDEKRKEAGETWAWFAACVGSADSANYSPQ